jgi:hypothetical protein
MRKSLALVLSLPGLFDSLYLLYTYTSPSRPMVCVGTGCDAMRASAYFTLWDVSMPVFGVLGYPLLAVSFCLLAALRWPPVFILKIGAAAGYFGLLP